MKYPLILFLFLFVLNTSYADDNVLILNLQFHWDILRDHPTVTQEFYATDKLGYTFFFMDVNFDRYRRKGGVSDFYFEIMRYFQLTKLKGNDVYFTVQYDDGSEPIQGVVLAGLNLGNIMVGAFNISTEFLLKKEYKLDLNWQYTLVWYAEFINGKLIFNGFLDYWVNDVDNPNWPSFDPELAASRYSFQAEPQLGWLLTPRWKIGSEVEISRGFLGSLTGKLAEEERYKHDKWYFLPTVFIQYNF